MPITKRQPLSMERVILEFARSGEVSYLTSDSSQVRTQLRLQDQPEQEVFRAIKILKRTGVIHRVSHSEPGRYQTSAYRRKAKFGGPIQKTSQNRTVTLRLDHDIQLFCDALWTIINGQLVLARYSGHLIAVR